LMNCDSCFRIETDFATMSEFDSRLGSITSDKRSFSSFIRLGGRFESLVEASLNIATLMELKKFSLEISCCLAKMGVSKQIRALITVREFMSNIL
jgi:hypothetical protein